MSWGVTVKFYIVKSSYPAKIGAPQKSGYAKLKPIVFSEPLKNTCEEF